MSLQYIHTVPDGFQPRDREEETYREAVPNETGIIGIEMVVGWTKWGGCNANKKSCPSQHFSLQAAPNQSPKFFSNSSQTK